MPALRYPTISRKLSTLVIILTFICSLSGCYSNNATRSSIEVKPKSAIIVVPGYYGTRLVRESDRKLLWISPSEALFGNQPLTLPIPSLNLTNAITLRPDTILDTIDVIPLLYSVDVYGSLLDTLRSTYADKARVIPFTYDWRMDLLKAIRSLDLLIKQLRQEGTQNITLVAHSLGGLLVSYYLRYGTQEIESAQETWEGAESVSSVVMAGVPFLGVMNSFRNMNFGITVKWNTSMLTSEAYSSFPSSYYTLPALKLDQLLSTNLTPLYGMIRNPQNWKQSGWGLLQNKSSLSEDVMMKRAEYMSYWLERSEKFLTLLHTPATSHDHILPPLMYLYAKGSPTLANGIWLQQKIQGSDSLFFDNRKPVSPIHSINPRILYEDGDETVSVRSALLPPAYHILPTTIRTYMVGHTELVTDPDIQEDILSFLEKPLQ